MIDAQTFRLDGRLALVTGSSSGIGLALAHRLAQAGASVVLNGLDTAKLATATAMLTAESLAVHPRTLDVTRRDAALPAVAEIESMLGPIEVLVNNAGMTHRAPFHEPWPTGTR